MAAVAIREQIPNRNQLRPAHQSNEHQPQPRPTTGHPANEPQPHVTLQTATRPTNPSHTQRVRHPGGPGGRPPPANTASPRRGVGNDPEHGATPGGYGGKPPGVAFIGVSTGARNAGSGAPTGDQSTDMNRTRKPPRTCQDPITSTSREKCPAWWRRGRALAACGRATNAVLSLAGARRARSGRRAGRIRRACWARLTRQYATFCRFWPILQESANVVRLATAVGEDDRNVRNEDREDRRYGREPAQMVHEQQNGDPEADGAKRHHDEVSALPVGNVLRHRPPGLRHHVHILVAGAAADPHPSTVSPPCAGSRPRLTCALRCERSPYPRRRRACYAPPAARVFSRLGPGPGGVHAGVQVPSSWCRGGAEPRYQPARRVAAAGVLLLVTRSCCPGAAGCPSASRNWPGAVSWPG